MVSFCLRPHTCLHDLRLSSSMVNQSGNTELYGLCLKGDVDFAAGGRLAHTCWSSREFCHSSTMLARPDHLIPFFFTSMVYLFNQTLVNSGFNAAHETIQLTYHFEMSSIPHEAKPDTLQEIFSNKCRRIDINNYNIYHFEEMKIEDRLYQYRLSTTGELMTVICTMANQTLLLVAVWTNKEHEARLREIHEYIKQRESADPPPDPKRALGGSIDLVSIVIAWFHVLTLVFLLLQGLRVECTNNFFLYGFNAFIRAASLLDICTCAVYKFDVVFFCKNV
ncbi:hypothetical protein Aperf_G00000111275 [Anoplocephala perfoliata]